jgi:MOB kinase activator 1
VTPTSGSFPETPTGAAPAPPSPGGAAGAQKPLYLCAPFVDAALVKGNYKTIVMLPKYVDVMEWVAKNSARVVSAADGRVLTGIAQSSTSTRT